MIGRASALALVLLLTGCAHPLGGKKFACPGMPGRPLCLPTTEIYRLTDGPGLPPASTARPSLVQEEYPLPAGSGWVWSKRIWQ